MKYYERTIKTEPIYEGSIFDIEKLTVELPNGKITYRDVIRNPGASVIVPITEDGHVILVKQYRKPIEEVSLEIPAGKLDHGEEPINVPQGSLRKRQGTPQKLTK